MSMSTPFRSLLIFTALAISVGHLSDPARLLAQDDPSLAELSPPAPEIAPADSAPIATRPEVTVTAFRRDDGQGNPGIAVAQFAPSDLIQHFEVGVSATSVPQEQPILVRWDFDALETSVSTTRRISSSEQQFTIPPGSAEVLLTGKVSLPREWPIGRYRATVSLGGVPLRMLDYVVAVAAPVSVPAIPSVTKLSMFSDDGRGKPGTERLQFVPGDRKIHFRAQLSAKFTGTARWRFTAVTTAAGNNVPLLDLKGDVDAVDFLISQMSAPQDWPIGIYRAELLLNETVARTLEFTISRG